MLLADLVEQSSKIAATRSRREKLGLLVDVLGKLSRHEVAAAVASLSGSLPQGRVGVGGAALHSARAAAAAAALPALEVLDVAQALERLAAARGRGSADECR